MIFPVFSRYIILIKKRGHLSCVTETLYTLTDKSWRSRAQMALVVTSIVLYTINFAKNVDLMLNVLTTITK